LTGPVQYIRPYSTAVLLAASLVYGAANPNNVLGSRPLRYIATISYALYVIHPATAHGWFSEGGTVVKYALKRPMSFILSFALAHLSTFYWEGPGNWRSKGGFRSVGNDRRLRLEHSAVSVKTLVRRASA
jgi:peptidoglycan/LPS O-acetylase OafA/YrhL